MVVKVVVPRLEHGRCCTTEIKFIIVGKQTGKITILLGIKNHLIIGNVDRSLENLFKMQTIDQAVDAVDTYEAWVLHFDKSMYGYALGTYPLFLFFLKKKNWIQLGYC